MSGLRQAVDDRREAARVAKCDRQEGFTDMYAALGDPIRQEEIRKTTPDKAHCRFLKASPEACRCFPAIPGVDIPEGQFCPNNPYEKPDLQRLFARVKAAVALSEDVDWWRVVLEAATVPSLHAISSEEFCALTVAVEERHREEVELRASASAMGAFMGG